MLFVRIDRRLEKLKISPMQLPIDLSRPGTYRGRFNHMCVAPPGGLAIYCEPVREGSSFPYGRDLLLKLECCVRVLAAGDEAVLMEQRFAGRDCLRGPPDRLLPGLRMSHFDLAAGQYELEILVESGEPKLADVEHQLVARYDASVLPIGRLICGVLSVAAWLLFLVCITVIVHRGK